MLEKNSLAQEIQHYIGNRIMMSLVASFIMLICFMTYTLSSELNVLQMHLDKELKPIENFVITQSMIENKHAIKFKLFELNSNASASTDFFKKIEWMPTGKPETSQLLLNFPLTWTYEYPLAEVMGYQFGYFKLTGSLLQDKRLISNLLGIIFLLLAFSLMLFSLLYPVTRKIPRKLFIEPVNHFLNIFTHSGQSPKIKKKLPRELQDLEKKITALTQKIQEHEQEKALIRIGQVAAQVAHDIRSPLTALNTALKYLTHIPEEQRILLRNVSNRINDIANCLLEQYTEKPMIEASTDMMKVCLLAPLLDHMVSEKRLQFDGKGIHFDLKVDDVAPFVFVQCNVSEMKRLLSNLINNSAEALTEESKKIVLFLYENKEDVVLEIRDTGIGIPEDILETIWDAGITSKEKGAGLGLVHAKQTMESFGGKIEITSVLNQGTTVSLMFPKAPTPASFASEITVYENDTVVIMEDDLSVHDAWKQRFKKLAKKITLVHLYRPQALKKWYLEQPENIQQHCVVLSDYECLGDYLTGLDVLEFFKLRSRAVLITSHYENPEIIERCKKNHIRLLPKNCLANVPIYLKKADPTNTALEFILIDDDEMLMSLFKDMVKKSKKRALVFTHPKEFDEIADRLDKKTPIYIDSQFKFPSGEVFKGEIWAKTLFEQGFSELYLATGYPAWHFEPMPWIKAILSKEKLMDLVNP